jgi:hypothetical protein
MMTHTQVLHSNRIQSTLRRGTVFAAVLAAFFCSAGVAAVEQGSFKAPPLDGYTMTSEQDADGDGDGLKETHVKHYSNKTTGDRLFSMTTKGKLWAWSLQSHAGASSVNNYVIRDSNCDGVFDQRYDLEEEFHVPDCLSYAHKP